MRVLHKILLHLIIAGSVFVAVYIYQTDKSGDFGRYQENASFALEAADEIKTETAVTGHPTPLGSTIFTSAVSLNRSDSPQEYSIWCIFTKVKSHAAIKYKFHGFAYSLIDHSSGLISLHIITDNSSITVAHEVLQNVKERTKKPVNVEYYDVGHIAGELQDIVTTMQPHFSSQPGTYYSDALFFLSLGLHRIAPHQTKAAMFDVDTRLRTDVTKLFEEFDRFEPEALFGLAPELTPVYRHVLYIYRSQHRDTRFGEPLMSHNKKGFPGVNSGVILFRLDRIRLSTLYNSLLNPKSVGYLTTKYSFKGHLGDQDFYTLLGMEYPQLIHLLPCTWNRQLCTWWREHGYRNVFEAYAHCEGAVHVYHGNCNTPIPED